jgi:hypothetical protein
MAIFGAGSKWDEEEVSEQFFADGNFIIGWDREHAGDLQSSLASLKIGDIIYLKANRPGSRHLRIKGIGIVKKSFIECLQSGEYPDGAIDDWHSFFIRVDWLIQEEFHLDIPEDIGRMTNIRAATFYEEPLPLVQAAIVERIVGFANRLGNPT